MRNSHKWSLKRHLLSLKSHQVSVIKQNRILHAELVSSQEVGGKLLIN